jgi:hypothetical protein
MGIYLFFAKKLKTRILINSNPVYYGTIFSKIVMQSLRVTNNLQSVNPYQDADLVISQTSDNYFRFSLSHFTHKDNEIFLTTLSQLLEPIQRPRYLIALNKKPSSEDLFPVPNILGANKKNADLFLQNWKKYMPEFKQSYLIATSSEIGRKLLLKLSAQQYSHSTESQIRLIDRWE